MGRIAFAGESGLDIDVYVVMLPDGGVTRLTRRSSVDMSPSWSPDGTRIAFRSDRTGDEEVFVMAADGSSVRDLSQHPDSDYSPAWSPSGDAIAFATNREDPTGNDVWLMDPDGAHQRHLVEQEGIDHELDRLAQQTLGMLGREGESDQPEVGRPRSSYGWLDARRLDRACHALGPVRSGRRCPATGGRTGGR